MNEPIGFIGAGNMGGPMIRNLLQAGMHVRVYDQDSTRSALLVEFGATQAKSVREVACPGGVVVSMVPDDEALRTLVMQDGLLDVLGAGVHLSLSTVSPMVVREIADRYALQQSSFVSATVSGRPDDAAAARLTILYAGSIQAKERVQPLLRRLGDTLVDLGERAEAANAVKLALNLPLPAIILSMAAGARMAASYGVPEETFYHLFQFSPMYANGKVFYQYADLLLQGLQARGFAVSLGIKDLRLMQETAHALGIPLPFVSEIIAYLQFAIDAGWGGSDWSVMGEAFNRQVEKLRGELRVSEQKEGQAAWA